MELVKISDNLYRLVIPYKDIFTTVYVIKYDEGIVIFDVGANEFDVNEYIIPALKSIGIAENAVKYVFISHNHRDHSGGLCEFMKAYPHACIVTRSQKLKEQFSEYDVLFPEDNDEIANSFRVITIPGHTWDSSALFDIRTNTLVTGDSLQLYGIFGSEDWGANITIPAEHIQAIEKLHRLNSKNIYAAHNFYPYGYKACGANNISLFLDACVEPLMKIKELIQKYPLLNDTEIREIYNSSKNLPRISTSVVTGVRKEL